MFRLRIGYLITGIATGLVLFFSFLATLPDGKLHLVFCDVGQGDAAYIRFPDGRDMLVDGGPNDKVLQCLGKHMPFWDRALDLVVLTHPQKDHMQGLIAVFERFGVDYFVRSAVSNDTEGYKKLMEVIMVKKIKERFVTQGEQITVGSARLAVLWPSHEMLARLNPTTLQGYSFKGAEVLGAKDSTNINDASVVLWLRYGSFDAILTGDADTRVEQGHWRTLLADEQVEVLKVPHHGSKTGMSEEFLNWLYPGNVQEIGRKCGSAKRFPELENFNSGNRVLDCPLAVISVGKNSYGHPAEEILRRLKDKEIKILRTDEAGDIEVVSDGKGWQVSPTKKTQ